MGFDFVPGMLMTTDVVAGERSSRADRVEDHLMCVDLMRGAIL